MSLREDGGEQSAKPQPASTATARVGLEPPKPHVTPRAGTGSGVQDLPALMRKSPVGLSGYGEAVKKLANTIREILKSESQDQETDIKIHVLDNQQRSTVLSAVIISVGTIRGTQSYAAAHALIVEASASRLPKITMNNGTQPIEYSAVAGDTYNAPMWDKVKAFVAESYPTNTIIRDASCTVIPTEMDLTDVDSVRAVLFYAIQGVYYTLENLVGHVPEPWSVSKFTRNDRVTAKIDFTPQPLITTTGLPVRSDVSIILNASNTQVNQYDMLPTAGKDFSRVDGYVDLVYKQPPRPAYGQHPVTQHYHPRFVMTNFAPLLEGVNLELLLLALSSATLLSRNDNYVWGGVFRQRYGAETNLRDIGAIGYDIPALVGAAAGDKGGKIDTQASSFTPESLYQLLSSMIHPRLVFSFDVEETGSLSFIHNDFVAAAGNNQDAVQRIVDACNRLTDNIFARHYPGGPIVYDDNNRVHLGYYIDGKGNRKDIRELDYLAILNMVGKNDPTIAAKWANTFDRTDIPWEQRLDERERLLTSLVGQGSFRITGYGRRITFYPQFVAALASAIAEAGLVIQPGQQAFFFGDQVVRGNDSIDQWAFAGMSANPLFNYTSPQMQNRNQQTVAARWGR